MPPTEHVIMPGRRKSSIAAEMSIKANIAGKSAPPPTKADEPVKKSTGTGKGKAKKGKKVHVLREEEVDDLEEEEDDMGGESMSRAKGVGSSESDPSLASTARQVRRGADLQSVSDLAARKPVRLLPALTLDLAFPLPFIL